MTHDPSRARCILKKNEKAAQCEWLARNSQIRRFKSFREAAVYESEVMAGLIALPAFAEQPCLGYCRPELQRERGLRLFRPQAPHVQLGEKHQSLAI